MVINNPCLNSVFQCVHSVYFVLCTNYRERNAIARNNFPGLMIQLTTRASFEQFKVELMLRPSSYSIP